MIVLHHQIIHKLYQTILIPAGQATSSISITQGICGRLVVNVSGDAGINGGDTIFNGCFSTTTTHILHRALSTLPTTNTAPELFVR